MRNTQILKKIVLGLVLACFAAAFFISPSKAEVGDFPASYNDAYNNYLEKLSTYQKAYTDFTNARDAYQNNQTLNLKETVRTKLYAFLIARDELISVYISILHTRLSEIPDHPGNEKGDILKELMPEYQWFKDHSLTYQKDDDDLNALFARGVESKNRYSEISNRYIYEALSTIALSHYLDLKIRHENIYFLAKSEVEKLEGPERTKYDRWVTDITAEFQKVTDIENEAHDIRLLYKDPKKKPEKIYSDFMENLNSAEQSYFRINGFVDEIVAALKLDAKQ